MSTFKRPKKSTTETQKKLSDEQKRIQRWGDSYRNWWKGVKDRAKKVVKENKKKIRKIRRPIRGKYKGPTSKRKKKVVTIDTEGKKIVRDVLERDRARDTSAIVQKASD